MSDWHEDDLQHGGIRIHYYRTGGDKPPLVLAHGFTDAGLCWTRVARDLEADYDVIMYDARGHGQSERVGPGYGYDAHVDDLAALIKGLGLERPGIMGHSMGAQTAALLAGSNAAMPGYVILEDPPWREDWADETDVERFNAAPPPVPARNEWRESLVALKAGTREQALEEVRRLNPTWDETELGPWVESKYQFDLNAFDNQSAPPPPWKLIAQPIRCPALLLYADPEAGGIVSPQTAAQAQALNPRLTAVPITGAGHNIRREQYERFLQAVKEFLARQTA